MNRFWLKTLDLLLIVFLLLAYNNVLEKRSQEETIQQLQAQMQVAALAKQQQNDSGEQQSEAKEAKATEAEKTTEQVSVTETVQSIYQDGEYEGSAKGFGGIITVKVTVQQDLITDIAILSADKEDRAYLEMASTIVTKMLEAQTVQVDTVSGATYSSTGIKNAVADALEQAKNR
jgi:uncharacterized protein with FMN-binding domain